MTEQTLAVTKVALCAGLYLTLLLITAYEDRRW